MKNSPAYKISLGLTVVLTIAAFFLLIAWIGTLINQAGSAPWFVLLPWKPLVLVALAAANCSFRARLIVRQRWFSR